MIHRNKRTTVPNVLVGALALILAGHAAVAQELATQTRSNRIPQLSEAAAAIVKGVGTVGSVWNEGSKGTVFVFEEFHTSRVGQLQIAAMLLRIHDQHGIQKIGLEGAIQSTHPLDATWFRSVGGDGAKVAREEVAVRMLAEGEISSAEFMALLFPDVQAFGTEIAALYNTELTTSGNPEIGYLLAIAEKGLSQEDIRKVNALIAKQQQKEALDYMLSVDPWIREQYEAIKGSANSGAVSLEQMRQRLLDIQAKVAEVKVTVEPATRTDAAAEMRFLDAGIKRSQEMTRRVVAESSLTNGPIAMIIGAAHTSGVMQQLRDANVSFVVITPLALNPEYGSLSTAQFDRKNKGRWARTSPGTLGHLLNPAPPASQPKKGGIRKPPPIIGTATAKSYANATLVGMLVAAAARDKHRVPEDIWDQIKLLPEVIVNRESFAVMGEDVVFSMLLTRTDGTKTTVWARVGSANTPAAARDLEGKLLQAAADLGGNDALPPTQPPAGTEAANDEGPGDGKRGNVVISRTGLRTLAVYGSTKESVVSIGKVSG